MTDAAIWAALACAVLAAALEIPWLSGAGTRRTRVALWLAIGAAALTLGTFLFLVSRFVVADLSHQVVFLYTRTDLALHWRIAGSWTSREGSLLLWTSLLGLCAAWMSWRHRVPMGGQSPGRASGASIAMPAGSEARGGGGTGLPGAAGLPGRTRDRGADIGGAPVAAEAQASSLAATKAWTRCFTLAALCAFLVAVLRQDTFAATPGFYLSGRPMGNGLNPTLRSAFILIHPPVMFMAYALATVPAAAALAGLVQGDKRWTDIAAGWSRAAWLLFTFAIGLGGMWAYYTLGFGGYWAWDPVEVANLLPWLALTVYLHAQARHRKDRAWDSAIAFLALLPLLLTLFSTISTRSGLWVSVHAFTDPANTFDPDPASRFLGLLAKDSGIARHTGLFLAVLLAGLGLWSHRLAAQAGHMRKWGRAVAIVLVAAAAAALAAPLQALSGTFHLAHAITTAIGRPSVGLGLLALTFATVLAAALPSLLRPEVRDIRSHRALDAGRTRLRLDLPTLAGAAVITLGLGLLVLFLLHMRAVEGWSTAFYESRVPWLAAPGLVGLFLLQAHGRFGRRRALALCSAAVAAAAAAAMAAEQKAGWFLLVLGVALLGVSLERVRQAGWAGGATKWQRRGIAMLWLAALLDLAFWLNPPTRPLGGFEARWPVQVLVAPVALYVLWGAHRMLSGASPRHAWHLFVLAGLLGGYVVAAPLALVGWLLARRVPPAGIDRKAVQRLRVAALYGIHLSVAILAVGYATSTYLKQTSVVEMEPGDTVAVGGVRASWVDTRHEAEASTPFSAATYAVLQVDGQQAAVPLVWESQAGAHFPHPATVRLWDRDWYANLQAVHVADTPGSCTLRGQELLAYQASARLCVTDTLDSVRLEASTLPGLGLVWSSLALALGYMTMWLATGRRLGVA